MSSPRVIVLALAVLVLGSLAPKSEAARAFFVFGDSLVDSGNNNFLITTARADSPPYGLDFPTHHPTGRFSNGFNLPDMISLRIGSVPTMPYLSPKLKGEKLLVGANFASAGIGILNDTGVQFLNIIKMFEQMEFFEQYQARVSALIGPAQTRRLVKQGLVLITLGGNDFINNYFMPFSDRSRQFSIPAFSKYLISEYKKILTRLYELGARRVLVAGTGPLGCVPAVLASSQSVNGECAPEPQKASAIFNPLLKAMIKELNTQLGADVFVIANAFDMNMDFISKPHKFGFVTSKVACCGQGAYNGVGLCNVLSSLCPYRNVYAFWDAYHPTERANRFIAEMILTGTIDYMYPMNLSTIMALDSST